MMPVKTLKRKLGKQYSNISMHEVHKFTRNRGHLPVTPKIRKFRLECRKISDFSAGKVVQNLQTQMCVPFAHFYQFLDRSVNPTAGNVPKNGHGNFLLGFYCNR